MPSIDEIKADEVLMTALMADADIAEKVRDGLRASGLNMMTEKELNDRIGEAVRMTHEAFEGTIKDLTGIEKPLNTKSIDYAKMAYTAKVEALTKEIENLKKPNHKNPVTDPIENQQIADLQLELKALKEERAQEKLQIFEAGISAEIGKIEMEIPSSYIEARFKAEHEYVEQEGRMFWKNKTTGKLQASAEKAGEPLTITEIIKTTYPEVLKMPFEKKSGLGLKDEARKDFTVDRQGYTYEEAEALLNKMGITDSDRDEAGNPKREKLLRQMTAKRYS